MSLPLDDCIDDQNVQHSPFRFLSAGPGKDLSELGFSRNNRHKRNVSISVSPSGMDYPTLLNIPREHPQYTYDVLTHYLSQSDQHIVFEQSGANPHVVISLPEHDPWIGLTYWLMAIEVVEPENLTIPALYPGPGFLPHQAPEKFLKPRSPLSSTNSCSDPGASLLLAAKRLRGAHIDDSADPSRAPHIIIQEAPPLDPHITSLNTVDDQDLQYGMQLAVPNKPAYNEPEDECEEYFEYYDGSTDEEDLAPFIQLPGPDMTPEDFYSMCAVGFESSMEEGEDDSEAGSRNASRPDSPLPQTPPDLEELDLPMLNRWSSYQQTSPQNFEKGSDDDSEEEDGFSYGLEISPDESAAMWKAGLEESLPDCYRIDEDDDDLPSLEDAW